MNRYAFLVLTGVTAFVIAFSLGSLITVTTGVPLAGGLLNGVLVAMILTIGMKLSPDKFSGTIMWGVFSVLAIFTTTLGPPGFYKPIIGLSAGIIWDICYRYIFGGRSRLGLYVGAILGGLVITFLLIAILSFFVSGVAVNLSLTDNAAASLERLQSFLWYLLIINVIVTVVGVVLGEYATKRFVGVINVK